MLPPLIHQFISESPDSVYCHCIFQGAGTWTTKSILELIEKEGERVALVLFSGI